MSADTSAQAASQAPTVGARLVEPIEGNERSFWLWLGFAAVLHLALLGGVVRHLPKQMGEASGLPEGISVELVDKADLDAKNSFAEDAAGAAAKPTPPTPPPKVAALPQPPAPTPAPQQSPPAPADEPVQKSAPPADPPEAAERPPQKVLEQAKTSPWAADVEAVDQASPPAADQPKRADAPDKAPPKKQQPVEQAPPPQPKAKPQEKLSLNLELPPPQAFAPGNTGAAVMRPPGITRSGENDEFGRGVIRALRRTMPTSSMLGQVTVRFLLSETGNLVEVRVVAPSRDPVFDQNVAFSVKQASFPIPPAGATIADRTFQVTYIYH
jgi:periplasmic protein TonB